MRREPLLISDKSTSDNTGKRRRDSPVSRVTIVDDSAIFLQGLKHILKEEFHDIVLHESKPPEAGRGGRPADVVVIGINIESQAGIKALVAVRRGNPIAKILVLAPQTAQWHVARALRLGALGCVSKNAPRSEFIKAFRCVIEGKQFTSNSTKRRSATQETSESLTKPLSQREETVMRALAAGSRNRDIAIELGLSVKTIGTFKRRILDKLKIGSTAELVRYGIDHELL